MLTMLLLLAAEPVDCPPVGSVMRDRMKIAGEICRDDPPPPKPAAPFKARPITASEKAEIMREADKLLFDGPSARWQWGERKSAHLYCGMVNAKNRLGAYVGWRPFYFFQGKFKIVPEGEEDVVYEGICSNAGYIEPPDWLKPKA